MKKILLCIILVVFAAVRANAQTANPDSTEEKMGTFPARIGWVNDYEKLLTKAEISQLEKLLAAHKQKSTDDIVIVTTNSFAPYHDMGSYSKDLATVWGVGKTKKNNGMMIMLSKTLGDINLLPDKGLQGMLSDTICGTIIDTKMMPYLEKEKFGDALIAGVKEIIRILDEAE